MTNGEKIKEIYPRTPTGVRLDVDGTNGTMTFTTNKDCWNTEYKEPVIRDNEVKDELELTSKNDPIDYRRAFKIACELLNGSVLYGVDADRIFEIMVAKDGVVSSDSYESYILNNLQELDRGQYASEPTTKNDLVLIHTEGLDEEIRCTMCTNSMKNDRGCDGSCVVNKDMYKAVMDTIEERIQPITKNDLGVEKIIDEIEEEFEKVDISIMDKLTLFAKVQNSLYKCAELRNSEIPTGSTTKNDLGVDCISREQALNEFCIYNPYDSIGVDKVRSYLKALPSITPQEPCEDAVSRQEVLYLVGDYDLSMGQVVRGIHALPSVTPQEPRKGHWTKIELPARDTYECSICGELAYGDGFETEIELSNFCPNCGCRMVEPWESEDKA